MVLRVFKFYLGSHLRDFRFLRVPTGHRDPRLTQTLFLFLRDPFGQRFFFGVVEDLAE